MSHTVVDHDVVQLATQGEKLTENPRGLPRPISIVTSLAGALILPLAFPDRGWWICAFIGVVLLLMGIRGQSLRFSAVLGFVSGCAFYLAHVFWTSLFLGPVPWIALCVLMGLWWAAAYPLIALAYKILPSHSTSLGRLGTLPVAIASVWALREALSSTVPYGGFAWGRLAQSQSDSPLVELVSWFGLTGLSFAIVWLCAFSIELFASSRTKGLRQRAGSFDLVIRIGVLALVGALLATWPLWPSSYSGTVRVLAVQGDTPGASYFIPSERGEILMAHADVTLASEDLERIDLILWPEGSVDVSPWYSENAADILDRVSSAVDAPILANTVTMDGEFDAPDTHYFNTQFLWEPSVGPTAGYDKAHPIPFGEYVPNRDFYMSLAPSLVGLIQREYTPGTRSNVLEVDGTHFGVFICYDIVDDALIRSAVAGGAEVLLTPTNNADFGRTDESGQQLATARLRAVETGRSVVQASTVGWSAAYLPDGTEIAALDWYEPGSFTVEIPTASHTTLAMFAGKHLEVLLSGIGLVLLLVASVGREPKPKSRKVRARR